MLTGRNHNIQAPSISVLNMPQLLQDESLHLQASHGRDRIGSNDLSLVDIPSGEITYAALNGSN
jgi:hypothetical protein